MKFADIKKPLNKETKIVNIDGNDITIKQNLTTNEVYDLVMITLQEAREDYMYNPLKLDIFFHVNSPHYSLCTHIYLISHYYPTEQ